jgi:hypothetical protein
MASDKHPEILAAAAYSDHRARHVPLLTAFERALKILDELFQRVEKTMYAGLGYKGEFDKKLADAAVALSRALSQAGAVHARLLEDENARADNMSMADKLKFMIMALKKFPPDQIRYAIAELQAAL